MPDATDIRTGRHVVYQMHAHLVFVTKFRHGVLTAEHVERLREIFTQVCADFEADLVEFDGEDDHVHLLVTYPPKVALTRMVNSLKGVSSRHMRREFPELERHYWRAQRLWSGSYYAGSVGGPDTEAVTTYIRNQRTPD